MKHRGDPEMNMTHQQVSWFEVLLGRVSGHIVPLKQIEYGFGSTIIRSPYTTYLLKGNYNSNIYPIIIEQFPFSFPL